MQSNEKTDSGNVSFKDKINDFIQRNRKIILTVTCVIAAAFIGAVVFLAVKDTLDKKELARIDDLNRRYETVKYNTEANEGEADNLISELEAFAGTKSGYPAGKAWSIIAEIYSSREWWPQAEEAWLKAAKAGNNTFLAPIALFNASAAAEEQGRLEQAIDLLQQCLSHKFEFPAAPRAQFSVGRLNEQLGNFSAASESYRALLINWPDLPVWPQLARSRIATIETQ